MIHPFLIDNGAALKKALIANKIFVASYWPNVLDWAKADSFEYNLAKNMIAVPVDQRYEIKDMNEVLKLLKI